MGGYVCRRYQKRVRQICGTGTQKVPHSLLLCEERKLQNNIFIVVVVVRGYVVSNSLRPRGLQHARLSFTISQSSLKLMSIESVMPSNHLILCCPLLLSSSTFPSIRVFSNESALHIGAQNIGTSASASVFPMNIQG